MKIPDMVATADDLIATYDRLRNRQNFTARKGVAPDRLIITYGLCAQAYDLGEDALRLIRSERYGAAAPLVRGMFECAVHVQWLVVMPEAANAMVSKAHRQRVALADNMAKASNFLHHAAATRQSAGPAPTAQPSMSARNFETICNTVDPAGNLYVMYRVLSGLSHPGEQVIERWLENIPDPPYIAWRTEPSDLTADRRDMLAGTLAVSLLWAAYGLDVMLRTRPLAKQLNAVATKLGHKGVLGGKLVIS